MLIISRLSPILLIVSHLLLTFQRRLRHFDITLTINHLTFLCKPTVSECLFNVYLIEELNLQGRLGPQQYSTNIQELTSYM